MRLMSLTAPRAPCKAIPLTAYFFKNEPRILEKKGKLCIKTHFLTLFFFHDDQK